VGLQSHHTLTLCLKRAAKLEKEREREREEAAAAAAGGEGGGAVRASTRERAQALVLDPSTGQMRPPAIKAPADPSPEPATAEEVCT
jgi:hypothetical protein